VGQQDQNTGDGERTTERGISRANGSEDLTERWKQKLSMRKPTLTSAPARENRTRNSRRRKLRPGKAKLKTKIVQISEKQKTKYKLNFFIKIQ
jgi:hypothetical protein